MVHINVKAAMLRENKQECFQQLGLIRTKNELGKPATEVAMKELKQLHDKVVFKPMSLNKSSNEKQRKALESLMFAK